MKKIVRIIILLLAIVVVVIVLRSASRGHLLKQDAPPLLPDSTILEKEIPVLGLVLKPEELIEVLTVNGVLAAHHRTQISSETGGRIIGWSAEIGDLLDRGDVVLEFDDELARLGLKQAEAALESARINAAKQERDWKKWQKLHEQGDLSRNDFEGLELNKLAAEASLAAAEAAVGLTQRSLRETKVRMPYQGRLALKFVEVGQSLPPGTPVAEVFQMNPIKLNVSLSEDQIVRVQAGQQVQVRTLNSGSGEYLGQVHAVGIAADLARRQFPVEIRIPNPDRKLIPGMSAVALIEVRKEENAIVVPRTAINFDGENPTALVVKNNRAELRKVLVGTIRDADLAIASGLQFGETVIVVGQNSVKPGQKVKLTLK